MAATLNAPSAAPPPQIPADRIRWRDADDRLSRLEISGPGFSVAIDRFQVVANSSGTGVEVSARVMRWSGLDSIAVIRNFSLDPGSADLLKVFTSPTLKAGCLIAFSDSDPRLATSAFNYWLRLTAQNKSLAPQYQGPVNIGPLSGGAVGTVTSVGLAMPSEFVVSGSPVTGAGTLAATKANQAANQVYAGPSSGSAAAPGFRALTVADLPLVVNRVVLITATGTYTPTSGTRAIYVECVGGGGAGGGTPATSTNNTATAGGGGGSGGYSASFISSVAASYNVTIGSGGAGASNVAGGAGGDTIFGSSVVVAKGGSGGGVGAAPSASSVSVQGAGGVAGTGDFAVVGNQGNRGVVVSGSLAAWGGGAASCFGGGLAAQLWAAGQAGSAGASATGAGAGGSGSVAVQVSAGIAAFAGGSGAAGVVRVWEFA